jgi:hypothetical protein
VPEAMFDAREAMKSLAYELPTATGFHTFRALEAVLRRYHAHVTGGQAPPKVRNIGVYLESLRRIGKGNPKVISAIKQIADLHSEGGRPTRSPSSAPGGLGRPESRVLS